MAKMAETLSSGVGMWTRSLCSALSSRRLGSAVSFGVGGSGKEIAGPEIVPLGGLICYMAATCSSDEQKHEGPGTCPLSGALRWLRGLDLNQRPLGYESSRGRVGNPLISRRISRTMSNYAFFHRAVSYPLVQGPSGSYGSRMGADDLWVLPNSYSSQPEHRTLVSPSTRSRSASRGGPPGKRTGGQTGCCGRFGSGQSTWKNFPRGASTRS